MSPDEVSIDELLPSIRVEPFPELVDINRFGRITSRAAYLECPKCLAIDNFYSNPDKIFDAIWCPGNLAPECEHEDVFGNKRKHQITCAPIAIPHFHVACQCCGNKFFLSIPEKK